MTGQEKQGNYGFLVSTTLDEQVPLFALIATSVVLLETLHHLTISFIGSFSTRYEDKINSYYFFLSARAGGIVRTLHSDWFRERAEFSYL